MVYLISLFNLVEHSRYKCDFETAFGIAVVLLIIVLGINLTTKALTKHFDVTRKE